MSKTEIERLQGVKKLFLTKVKSLKQKSNTEKQIEAFEDQIDFIDQQLNQAA